MAGEAQPSQPFGDQIEQPQQPAQTKQQHEKTGEVADGDAGQKPADTGHHSTIPEMRQSRYKDRYGEKNQKHRNKRPNGCRRRGRANRNAASIKKPKTEQNLRIYERQFAEVSCGEIVLRRLESEVQAQCSTIKINRQK